MDNYNDSVHSGHQSSAAHMISQIIETPQVKPGQVQAAPNLSMEMEVKLEIPPLAVKLLTIVSDWEKEFSLRLLFLVIRH